MKRLVLLAVVMFAMGFQGNVVAQSATPSPGTPVGAVQTTRTVFTNPSNLVDQLALGTPNEVSIIAQTTVGANGVVAALVKNDTAQAVGSVSVTASVANAQGVLVAVGVAPRTFPAIIPPNGVAQAFVNFQGSPPAGAAATLSVTAGEIPSYSSANDLSITQAGVVGTQLIGIAMNDSGPSFVFNVYAVVTCVAPDGSILASTSAKLASSLSKGQAGTFAIDLGSVACDRYVLAVGDSPS